MEGFSPADLISNQEVVHMVIDLTDAPLGSSPYQDVGHSEGPFVRAGNSLNRSLMIEIMADITDAESAVGSSEG